MLVFVVVNDLECFSVVENVDAFGFCKGNLGVLGLGMERGIFLFGEGFGGEFEGGSKRVGSEMFRG